MSWKIRSLLINKLFPTLRNEENLKGITYLRLQNYNVLKRY
jgi:hypothetical protein